jgi:hypothetical protein
MEPRPLYESAALKSAYCLRYGWTGWPTPPTVIPGDLESILLQVDPLRGNIEHSPEEIAMGLLNNLAFALGQVYVWQPGYYAGTFSEYDMDAVRRRER